jgi:hypothetical protein
VVSGKLVLNPNVGRAYWNDCDADLTLVEYNIVNLSGIRAIDTELAS